MSDDKMRWTAEQEKLRNEYSNVGIFNNVYAVKTLMIVREQPGRTKTEIMKQFEDRFAKTIFVRIQELIWAGLIEYRFFEEHHIMRLYITEKGEKVVNQFDKIDTILKTE